MEETIEVVQHNPQKQARCVDEIIDMPVLMQRQVLARQTVQKTVELPQVQFLDRVVDVPVVTLVLLASRISAILKFGTRTGEVPFSKVKGLFTELFGRLQEEASSEASRKACCDEETSKAIAEKEDREADIAKHSSRLATCLVLPYSTSRSLQPLLLKLSPQLLRQRPP